MKKIETVFLSVGLAIAMVGCGREPSGATAAPDTSYVTYQASAHRAKLAKNAEKWSEAIRVNEERRRQMKEDHAYVKAQVDRLKPFGGTGEAHYMLMEYGDQLLEKIGLELAKGLEKAREAQEKADAETDPVAAAKVEAEPFSADFFWGESYAENWAIFLHHTFKKDGLVSPEPITASADSMLEKVRWTREIIAVQVDQIIAEKSKFRRTDR